MWYVTNSHNCRKYKSLLSHWGKGNPDVQMFYTDHLTTNYEDVKSCMCQETGDNNNIGS